MKKITMITTLSPEKQYEIYRWFWGSIFLCVCCIIIGTYFIAPQAIVYWQLKQEVAAWRHKTREHATLAGNKEALTKEFDEMHMRSSKIEVYQKQKKNPYRYITEIIAACSNDIHLESITFGAKNVETEIVCLTAENANIYIKRLSASPHFSQVKMISLQQDTHNQRVRCKIKAFVVF